MITQEQREEMRQVYKQVRANIKKKQPSEYDLMLQKFKDNSKMKTYKNEEIEKLIPAVNASISKYGMERYESQQQFDQAVILFKQVKKDIKARNMPMPSDDNCNNLVDYVRKCKRYLNDFNPDL